MFVLNTIMWLTNRLARIVAGSICFGVVWFLISFVINLIPSKASIENNYQYETRFYPLNEFNVDGSFVAKYNYLNRVDVLFKNPNLESRDELEIFIKNDNNVTVYSQKFTGFNFGDTSNARLDFESIPNSADKMYKVFILPTKIVDGKLHFGIKNNQINIVQYYNVKFNVRNSFDKSISIFNKILFGQPFVFILPVLLIVLLLW